MIEAPAVIDIRCIECSLARQVKRTKANNARLPIGWKRNEQQEPVCSACWNESFILRALTFPVVSPLSGSWEELGSDLKTMWVQTTAAANWMMTECYTRDVRRNGEAKMPPMPKVYLYPEARIKFPNLPPQ